MSSCQHGGDLDSLINRIREEAEKIEQQTPLAVTDVKGPEFKRLAAVPIEKFQAILASKFPHSDDFFSLDKMRLTFRCANNNGDS